MLKEFQEQIQQQVQELRHEVAALKEDHMDPTPPKESLDLDDTSRCTVSSPLLDPIPHDTDPSLQRIQGAGWAEEMEILKGTKTSTGSAKSKRPTRVARVTPATEALLKRSFVSLVNKDRIDERNVYVLPKVAVTKVPSLDKVMATHCSKSTKTNDWTLSRIQALTLDARPP